MTGRDSTEAGRASTPLELLFDLTFVVAVSEAAASFSHSLARGQLLHAVSGYLMVFFAIWWAWVNFTWFASAYDTDDAGYRILTLLQMGGVLVLAAGVPAAFEGDYRAVTLGYVVMRVALVVQWSRAALSDGPRRSTAMGYVVGIALVQAGWVARLALPQRLGLVSFLLLCVAELTVPLVAERRARTPWHPHHIAERYGLFTIIVLGECVLAATEAMQSSVAESGWGRDAILLAAGGLGLLFLLWWAYFSLPAGSRLERRPELAWLWGYGHYAIFAALAALGGALEAATESLAGPHGEVSNSVLGLALAVPVAVFLLVLAALHAPLEPARLRHLAPFVGAAAAVLAIGMAPAVDLPLAWCVLLLCLPVAALVVGMARRSGGGAEVSAPRWSAVPGLPKPR